MKPRLSRYRMAILAGFVLLLLLLGLMVTNLLSQLRDLSVAASDNTQWSISQLDTEFANLNATLSEQLSDGSFTQDEVKLRIDIAISRTSIINSGRAAVIFGGNEEAKALIDPINAFVENAIAITDQDSALSNANLREIRRMVQDVRPNVRQIALLGVSLGAQASENRREQFAQQLAWTGGFAITFLVMMGGLMVVLDRLVRRAARRDAELLTSSRLLSSTVAASLDAIVTADDQGRIIEFNASAESVFGWTRDEIIGQTMEQTFIPPNMREAHTHGMNRYLETGKPRVVDGGRVELAALRKSGEEFPVELNITSIKGPDGTTFVAYIRDISARKIDEQKLIDARDRAERTDKAKSQFLTVMSHEMRTPLNGIMGVLDLLKTTELTSQQDRYTKIATASSEILLEHINEALDITRIETGTLQMSSQNFDLPELVASVVDVLEPLANEKQLALTLDVDDAMCMDFYGDSSRVRQILTNLIGNAIKFTDDGRIRLAVSGIHGPDVSVLNFAVSDTGAGIASEHQEQIFEDFVALAHGEGRQTRGDGLGLSISRKIARQLGGDIILSSEMGQGSNFTLTIPLERRSGPLSEQTQATINRAGQGRPCKILIVEDNTINRKVLRDMLQSMGHHVQEAVNGADGIEQAAKNKFDVIFMDISMPVMGGIEATHRLRAEHGPNMHTHIVGLTAHGQEEYREKAEKAGMDRFKTKPIRLDALKGTIAEVLSIAHAPLDTASPPEALQELCEALGSAKVLGIGDTFFAEMDALVESIQNVSVSSDFSALADAVHKLKGAAALLGQDQLMPPLTALEDDALCGERADLDQHVAQLQQITEESRKTFKIAVTTADV